MAVGDLTQDLTVRGELIERVYSNYVDRRYIVNRRYQRKLIWSLDEKIAFLDSVIMGYPVPIILLAEDRSSKTNQFEIIDGMQRLNALMSFLENDFEVQDGYFDLQTMAVTKALLDRGALEQKCPTLSREKCVKIASYLLPLSIYEFNGVEHVDEVFRRINSGGRMLSRQELRAAGATGHFAQSVRRIAAKVRGDDSYSDVLKLNDMKRISITGRDLDYGIVVEDVFWVKEGILTKDQVRESRDEELIADIVAYMASDEAQSSRSEFLDDYFSPGMEEASINRYSLIEAAVQRRGVDLVISDFQRTIDELKLTLASAGANFGQLLFGNQPSRAPRYFQAVFIALFFLIVKQNKRVTNRSQLVQRMRGSGPSINVPEGGRWGADQRQRTIEAVVGTYLGCFGPDDAVDPALVHWITQLQNLLTQSFTEQSAYDFKQGFLRLDSSKQFDEASFEKIMQTCVGISNIHRGYKGYVLVGIADKVSTAERAKAIFGVDPRPYEGFYILGVDHEATSLGKSVDQMFQMLADRIRDRPISNDLKNYMTRNLKCVRYYDRTIIVFEVRGQEDPSEYDGVYYIRRGAQLDIIDTRDLGSFIRQYISS